MNQARFGRSDLAFRWDALAMTVPARESAVIDVWYGVGYYAPLAGHSGDCNRVTVATVSGRADAPCSCGAIQK